MFGQACLFIFKITRVTVLQAKLNMKQGLTSLNIPLVVLWERRTKARQNCMDFEVLKEMMIHFSPPISFLLSSEVSLFYLSGALFKYV